MNSTFHRPQSIEIAPTRPSLGRNNVDLFDLGLRYRLGGHIQFFLGVYVPKTLQSSLLNGEVNGLHIETLEVNSIASRCLLNAPNYIILRITLITGETFVEIPKVLGWARNWRIQLGSAICVLGGFVVFSAYGWVGTVAILVGNHLLRAARQIPNNPHTVYKERI